MTLSEINNKWNNFWFKQGPVEGIAIFRILLGVLAIITFFQDVVNMEDFWGPYAIQSFATGMKNYSFPILNIFQYFDWTYGVMYFFVTVQFIAILFFIFGYQTKIASLITFVLLVSFQQRTINMLSSADLLLRILFMYMIFAPAANAYSIDSLIAKLKGKPLTRNHSIWVHRLIQIQIAVVYVSTVIAKSKGETWLDGSAVYYATRLTDLTRFPVPFLLDWKWSVMLLTWSTLLIELSLGTLIFIDELRKPLIFFGILFHLGIEYMMSIPTFEWLMIVGLLAMFKIDDYRIFNEYLKKKITIQIENIEFNSKLKSYLLEAVK